ERSRTLASLSAGELLALHHELTEEIRTFGAAHVLVSIYTGSVFTGLGKICQKWLGDARGEMQGRLCKGLDGMDNARPAFELGELAHPGGQPNRLESFLGRHGHLSSSPMELRQPTWEEEPSVVERMIQNYVDADPEVSPAKTLARGQSDRRA